MKKVLLILVSLAMVLSMAGVVSADDEAGSTTLDYTVGSNPIYSIPASLSIDATTLEETYTVGANVLLPEGVTQKITIESANGFYLVYGKTPKSKVQYTAFRVNDDGSEDKITETNNEVLRIVSGNTGDSQEIKFNITNDALKMATKSGTHTDILTFTIQFIRPWDGKTADISWYDDTVTEFTLTSAEQLAGLAKLVDDGKTFEGKTIKLAEDMDLGASDANGNPISICFDPIGSYRNDKAFKGTFDGQGHTIRNLNQNTWALDNGYYYGDLGLGLFGLVENATIKNLNIDRADISGESAICGVVAATSYGTTTYENIKVSNSNCADYQYYAGGIVGWASGKQTFINCHVDASNKIAAQWGDFDNSIGGVIGGAGGSAEIVMNDCIVECRIDAYNDVTSSYQWYSYRRAGMLIGNTGKSTVVDGTTYATAPQLKCQNVKVIYNDWANYHYCEFAGTSWPYVRCEEGVSNSAYSNPRYGHPTDANGNEVIDDNHVHNDGEDHQILCQFDQLYGGGQGVYGTATHDGVTVIYNNKETT